MRIGIKAVSAYSGVVVISLIMTFWLYGLKVGELGVPQCYNGDAISHSCIIKGIIDNGWFLHNRYVGMPTGLDFHDYPIPDNLHLLLIKFIALFSHNYAVVVNVFYILTFPLVTLSGVFVLRRFGVSYPVSVLVGLLYSLLPYHFARGESHLFLSAYYTVPLTVMVALWVFSEAPPLVMYGEDGRPVYDLKEPRSVGSLVICALASSAGVYYAFFTCFFLVVAGLSASVSRRNRSNAVAAALLSGVILAGIVANVSPTLIYQHRHGKNKEAVGRSFVDSEIYGLKIAQLILPVDMPVSEGINKKLMLVTKKYNGSAPLVNENTTAGLGYVGGFGFLFLVGILFYRRPQPAGGELYHDLSLLNIAGVLLATIGGFGSLLALLGVNQIRSYNRVSVYIAFFSLFAIGLLLDRLYVGCQKTAPLRFLWYVCLAALLLVGLGEVNIRNAVVKFRESARTEFLADETFIRKVEGSVPTGSMIFQLPYARFPEYPAICRMAEYDHLKAYLHSKSLRWSYGAMKGREADRWQGSVSTLPIGEMVKAVGLAGFSGIYIDRFGYPDKGKEIETKISAVLGSEPIVSDDGRHVFFNMTGYSKRLAPPASPVNFR